MTLGAYIGRAVSRLRQRGAFETFRYSSHVVTKALCGAAIDLAYGSKLSTTRRSTLQAVNDDASAVMHTDYYVLRAIFDRVKVGSTDILVDAGCGDGRVIAFWLSRGLRNQIIGIELDEDTARDTKRRFARYPNVSIIHADAAAVARSYNGTIVYLYNPFIGATLQRFAQSLEDQPATVIYYNYSDLSAFSDWRHEILRGESDECQYRVAILTPRNAGGQRAAVSHTRSNE
jgi:methyltransferase family protein